MDLVPVPWLHHLMESRPHGYVLTGISNAIRAWLYERVDRYRLVIVFEPAIGFEIRERIYIELDPDTAFEFAMHWR
jgi:hypothetical protein